MWRPRRVTSKTAAFWRTVAALEERTGSGGAKPEVHDQPLHALPEPWTSHPRLPGGGGIKISASDHGGEHDELGGSSRRNSAILRAHVIRQCQSSVLLQSCSSTSCPYSTLTSTTTAMMTMSGWPTALLPCVEQSTDLR